jgi:hypothetical protein
VNLQSVDHSALKTNQAAIISLNILAFVFDQAWIAVVVTIVMAIGTLIKRPGFGFIYARLLKPRGWVKPDVLQDNPEPHRFSQGLGAVVMGLGTAALAYNIIVAGWALIWVVIALASLNLFGGFCVGCALYYWLGKLNLPGFGKTAPEGSLPGTRSRLKI